jgi:hypothetical protein
MTRRLDWNRFDSTVGGLRVDEEKEHFLRITLDDSIRPTGKLAHASSSVPGEQLENWGSNFIVDGAVECAFIENVRMA